MTFIIPRQLLAACGNSAELRSWLDLLPNLISQLQDKWSLSLESPFSGPGVSCAWVARALRRDGTHAVLKLGMPHMEATHEIQGLQFWDGDPTVRVLEAELDSNAMLLEYCDPGTGLGELAEPEQDVVIAGLLRRLWRKPAGSHPFRPLADMTAYWAKETMASAPLASHGGMIQEGLRLFAELSQPSFDDVLLGTDIHAGNVLRAQREPWLVIDPKPFVGDRAYDVTQHLFNCQARMLTAPTATIRRLADRVEVDAERIRLWMFARAAAEPRERWNDDSLRLAKLLR